MKHTQVFLATVCAGLLLVPILLAACAKTTTRQATIAPAPARIAHADKTAPPQDSASLALPLASKPFLEIYPPFDEFPKSNNGPLKQDSLPLAPKYPVYVIGSFKECGSSAPHSR